MGEVTLTSAFIPSALVSSQSLTRSFIMSKSLALAFATAVTGEEAQFMNSAVNGGAVVTVNQKTGASGSIGYLLAYGDKASRNGEAARRYYGFLAAGNYRPVLMDIITAMVPKANQDWILAGVPTGGARISQETTVGILRQIKSVYDAKRNKEGQPVELKGKKADYMAFIENVLRQAEPETIEA
jgi:hypothetical protein